MPARQIFVDEAGDATLFDRQGRIIVGQAGVSSTFMVGTLHLPDPTDAEARLATLRAELLADPYFRDVPSMQPAAQKTSICFHAKDDVSEVRREVFRLIGDLNAKVVIAIRRKRELAEHARYAFTTLGTKVGGNEIYDDLVRRSLDRQLHKAESTHIVFARRGKSDR